MRTGARALIYPCGEDKRTLQLLWISPCLPHVGEVMEVFCPLSIIFHRRSQGLPRHLNKRAWHCTHLKHMLRVKITGSTLAGDHNLTRLTLADMGHTESFRGVCGNPKVSEWSVTLHKSTGTHCCPNSYWSLWGSSRQQET